MASRLETVMDDLVSEYEEISTSNGYRNTVNQVLKSLRRIDHVKTFPEIGIEFQNVKVKPIDQAWTVFDTFADVVVVGMVGMDTDTTDEGVNVYNAAQSLLQDIMTVTASIFSKYIISGNAHKWNVSPNTKDIDFMPPMLEGDKRNRAIVAVSFQVQIRHQDKYFDYGDTVIQREKKMVVDITQSGTSAPTASEIFNTIVGTPTYARSSANTYTITLTGKFTLSKTDCYAYDMTDIVSITHTDVNTITIVTNADSVLTSRRFVIVTYA